MDIDIPLNLPEIKEAPVEEQPKLNRHQRRALIAKFKRFVGKVNTIRNLRKQRRQSRIKRKAEQHNLHVRYWEVN